MVDHIKGNGPRGDMESKLPWVHATKLEYCCFNGDDFDNKIVRAKYLFKVDGTPMKN